MEHQIGFYVKTISQLMGRHFNRQLKDFDLTKAQYDVLLFLFRSQDQELIQRDIETQFKISNPTVTGILNRLEDKGFIVRKKSSRDKRVHSLKLTSKGKELISEMCKGRLVMESAIQKALKPEQLKELENFLRLIMEHLEKEEEKENA